jgi:hypothetical protein
MVLEILSITLGSFATTIAYLMGKRAFIFLLISNVFFVFSMVIEQPVLSPAASLIGILSVLPWLFDKKPLEYFTFLPSYLLIAAGLVFTMEVNPSYSGVIGIEWGLFLYSSLFFTFGYSVYRVKNVNKLTLVFMCVFFCLGMIEMVNSSIYPRLDYGEYTVVGYTVFWFFVWRNMLKKIIGLINSKDSALADTKKYEAKYYELKAILDDYRDTMRSSTESINANLLDIHGYIKNLVRYDGLTLEEGDDLVIDLDRKSKESLTELSVFMEYQEVVASRDFFEKGFSPVEKGAASIIKSRVLAAKEAATANNVKVEGFIDGGASAEIVKGVYWIERAVELALESCINSSQGRNVELVLLVSQSEENQSLSIGIDFFWDKAKLTLDEIVSPFQRIPGSKGYTTKVNMAYCCKIIELLNGEISLTHQHDFRYRLEIHIPKSYVFGGISERDYSSQITDIRRQRRKFSY